MRPQDTGHDPGRGYEALKRTRERDAGEERREGAERRAREGSSGRPGPTSSHGRSASTAAQGKPVLYKGPENWGSSFTATD